MATVLLPADAVSGAPTYSGRKWRQAMAADLAGATTTRPLGARSGVRPGTPVTTVEATSTTVWTIKPHAGVLDLEAAAEAGPYRYATDANITGAITAASGAGARIDILYATVTDLAEDGTAGTPGVSFGYLAGTAGSGAPPATPARSMVLGWINVPISGGGAPTATLKAPYVAAAGGIIPVRNQAERDAITSGTPEAPVTVDRLSVGAIERSVTPGEWVQIAGGRIADNAYYQNVGGTLTSDLPPATNPPTTYTAIISFALPSSAPAGRYRVSSRIGMFSSATPSRAYHRIRAGATVLDESRCDVETAITRFYTLEGYFDHAGGAINLTLDVMCAVAILVVGAGSTMVRGVRI